MKPLTKEQLRDNAAAMLAFADGKPIQFDSSGDGWTAPMWLDTDDLTEIETVWHRPKPQPVARPWSKPEDVPLNCWIRDNRFSSIHIVTQLSDDGIWAHGLGMLVWGTLEDYEYSTDRVTWKPCTVEDAQ
jgi:hypothetical protein